MSAFDWVKAPSGGWWLFDKPTGTPRAPVASIYGSPRIGYRATVHSPATSLSGKSVPALKREIETIIAEDES